MVKKLGLCSLLYLSIFIPNCCAKIHYEYFERKHSINEDMVHIGSIYTLSWIFYYATQRERFINDGSFKNYRQNFGHIVFDQDAAIWNWVAHPYAGSQYYLFYRARSYSRMESVAMAFIQSALFEFTIEAYTEKASIQDLYQTPVLGALLGILLEEISLKLLNGNFFLGNIVGHILNPSSLFWFYEGTKNMQLTPNLVKNGLGLSFNASF